MENSILRQNKNRAHDGYLVKPFKNSRTPNKKQLIEVLKIDDPKTLVHSGGQNLNFGNPSQIELKLIKDLEKKLGFCLPKKNIDSVAEHLKGKLLNTIACSLFELNEFCKKIQKVLERSSQFGDVDWKVSLGSHEFIFHITEEGCSKMNPPDLFNFSLNKSKSFKRCKEKPDPFSSEIQDYSEQMFGAFENREKLENNKKDQLKFSKKSEFLITKEAEIIRRKKEELNLLKNSLEWQKEELLFFKNEAKHKANRTTCQETILETEISNLREKRVSIAYEYENIEKAEEKLENKKKTIQNIISELKRFTEYFGKPESDSPDKIKQEISELEQQLKDLENQLKNNYSQESLHLQVNRLKTKISTLKAKNAISQTYSATSSARQKMVNFTKTLSLTKFASEKCPLSSFCSPLSKRPDLTKVNSLVNKPSLINSSERSLSLSQTDLGTRETQVSQQQGRVAKRVFTTPDPLKLFKGMEPRTPSQDRQIGSEHEDCNLETTSSLIEQKGNSPYSALDCNKKAVEEKARIQDQVEHLKEFLMKALNEILNN